ncbi:MAG: tetratricopeptide repeat protein [Taibaiella sp.]|nr:tetratricopeptide repeat protein [Taibaiella sp.]
MTGHIKKRALSRLILAAICAACGATAHSQVLYPDQPTQRPHILAEEQYRQQHYALAAQSARLFFTRDAAKIATEQSLDAERARYQVVIGALKTNAGGGVAAAEAYIKSATNPAYAQRVSFAVAQYYFLENKLAEAIPYYQHTDIANLSNSEIADSKFELAYCLFNVKQFDKAEPLFLSIKELKDGKYYGAGNYYYGLLTYNQSKFKEALQSFERIKDDREYKAIVPYYIAEIYYFMGDRVKALEVAKAILAGASKSYYDNELHLLAAQCYFEDKQYAEAKPYFDYYYDHNNQIKKEDLYKMGYCCYRLADWKGATGKFKLLSGANDSLGQSSMYLLGDCYLKTGDRQSARNAFGICAEMPYNPGQQEASMMLHARLSYEAGFDGEALAQLRMLNKTYPSSEYKDESNTLISSLLLSTNDFEGALKHLEEVGNKEKGYWKIYQKASYGIGVQRFRSGDFNGAYQYFSNSLRQPTDVNFEAAACFWRGELDFRQHKYAEAISHSQEFLNKRVDKAKLEVISPQATAQHACLNMGFAAMELQNFNAAQTYFSRAQQGSEDEYSGMVANLSEADAVFMQQNYARAITLYDKIVTTDTANADYARYQKSIILGLQGKNAEKIKVLEALVNRTPPSVYAITARYEIAATDIELNHYPQALGYLRYLTDTATDKSAAPKAWMKTGFVYQQNNDPAKAIEAYKHVVTDYPASDERIAALDALKSLYIQGNQPSAYAQLLKENNLPSAENSSLDSTYYSAAETQFAAGKWDNSARSFSDYLKEYPNGVFAIKAHYYRGESRYQLKDFKGALEDFNIVLATGWNDFSENSARHAAGIAFDQKNYPLAYDYYGRLRANTPPANKPVLQTAFEGLVKSGYNAEKFNETDLYADTLLAMPGLPADLINDALLYKARANQHLNRSDTALALYRQLSGNKNGEIAAESRYHIAEILVAQDSLKDGEEAANETIKQSQGYDYWIVKSYILLGDIMTKQKDFFNAKATLGSIIKHTKNAELKLEATKKLAEVKALEQVKSKLKEE